MFEESVTRKNRSSGKALIFCALLLGGACLLSLSFSRQEEPMALLAQPAARTFPQMSPMSPKRMPFGNPHMKARCNYKLPSCFRSGGDPLRIRASASVVRGADAAPQPLSTIYNELLAFDMSTVTFPIKATCQLSPKGAPCGGGEEQAPGCTGSVTFTQLDADTIEIEWDIENAGKEGLHGFHVHNVPDFSNGCISTGPHYNPFNKLHGAPEDEERHLGGLGNIKVDANGKAKGSLKDSLVKLFGPTTCVGRPMLLHADEDDLGLGDNSKANEPGPPQNGFVSKITGNAGARIACGEIVLLSDTSSP
jgi:Cu-Zn family superoxide dismutase